jgi:predicted membrane protein
MKTSFFFIVWILIYPILGLFNSAAINNNTFFIALIVVFFLARFLQKSMPNVLAYDQAIGITDILETVYTNNIRDLRKRLHRDSTIELLTSIYFAVTVCIVLMTILRGSSEEWFTLLVFAFLLCAYVVRCIKIFKGIFLLKKEANTENCVKIVEDIYKLNYEAYYDAHIERSVHDMLPPRPKFYSFYSLACLVFAIICSLLGATYIIYGIILQTSESVGVLSGMYTLYGVLALYFGIKDSLDSWHSIKKK